MVKFVPKNSEVLEQAIVETSTTKKAPLGTVVRCWDNSSDVLGEADFIYSLGVASTVVGSLSEIVNVGGTASVLGVAAGKYRRLGVAMSANVASQYGWYQISGKALVKVLPAFAAGADCYLTSTAGSIDDANVSGDLIRGMVGITARDAETAMAFVSMNGACFTTAGDEILDEDNTFTGANTFEGTTSFDGDTTIETGNTFEVADNSGIVINTVAVDATALELNTKELNVKMTDVSTAGSVFVSSPVAGTYTKMYGVLDGVIATAPAVITTTITNNPVTNGGMSFSDTSSSAGFTQIATPSAQNTVSVGDYIEIITSGASTNTVSANFTVVITL